MKLLTSPLAARSRTLVRAIAAAGLLVACSTAADAAADGQVPGAKAGARLVLNCGNLPNTVIAQSSVAQSTTLTSNEDIIGSTVNFTVGGTAPSCVIVSFSAQAFAPSANDLMFVRALLDGVTESVDGEIQLVAESRTLGEAHAYNFLFRSVSPGPHQVKMQYRSRFFPSVSAINDFNLTVRHR